MEELSDSRSSQTPSAEAVSIASFFFGFNISDQKTSKLTWKSPFLWLYKTVKSSFLWLGPSFVILLLGTGFSIWLIPRISSNVSYQKLLQDTRQQKILEFGGRDREFNSKLNALRITIGRFSKLPFEMKFKPDEIKKEQMLFRKEYGDRYLALDEMAWWWYWDFEREAKVLKLVNPDQFNYLHSELEQYGRSIDESMKALSPLSEQLSTEPFKTDQDTRNKLHELNLCLKAKIDQEREIRRDIIGRIYGILRGNE